MLITFLNFNLKVPNQEECESIRTKTFSKLFYFLILNISDISHAFIFNQLTSYISIFIDDIKELSTIVFLMDHGLR